jgi:hypothetical protein
MDREDGSEDPEEAASSPEEAQDGKLDQDTVDALWRAYAVCTGAASPPEGGDTPDAMGLILSWMPALLTVAEKVLDPEGRITRSAHTIL